MLDIEYSVIKSDVIKSFDCILVFDSFIFSIFPKADNQIILLRFHIKVKFQILKKKNCIGCPKMAYDSDGILWGSTLFASVHLA